MQIVSSIICIDFLFDGCTFSISSNGDVYSFGIREKGFLGHTELKIFPPKLIPSLQNIKSISCCHFNTMCLDFEGNVFTFGHNGSGELGFDKDILFLHFPQRIPNLPKIIQISCGASHCMFLSENNELYCFGCNFDGQLGFVNRENHYLPQKIDSLQDIEFVECGEEYTICKQTNNNNIFVWGNNDFGQLGTGNTDTQFTPFHCSNWPDNIIDIKCGRCHTLILTSNQDVYSCGNNYDGQLGRSSFLNSFNIPHKIINIPNITRIECGFNHSLCIDINNDLYVFGDNSSGQLGLNDTCGKVHYPTKNILLSNVIDISKGGDHTFVKTLNNEIYAFGRNNFSQLGIKTEERLQISPIQVFQDNDDFWRVNISKKSKAKSARFVSKRPIENNSPPNKKKKIN